MEIPTPEQPGRREMVAHSEGIGSEDLELSGPQVQKGAPQELSKIVIFLPVESSRGQSWPGLPLSPIPRGASGVESIASAAKFGRILGPVHRSQGSSQIQMRPGDLWD